ncbi:MAG TPA: HAMP domain-containing sensor histidine kinase [Polyangiaceae bacterium]|nr:HAMP domain-containing sensor histidine kinase [Polyangiaceae bacterium]
MLTRVALGATVSAVLAALVAAVVTSVFATYLVRRVDDRRIMDAALVLSVELTDAAATHDKIGDVVARADREMSHTGISFAVFDGESAERLAGDPTVPWIETPNCVVLKSLHACATQTDRGLWVVASTAHKRIVSLLALSSALAALLAGLGAWIVSRPVASLLIGPLSELRQRVGSLDMASGRATDLGAPVGIAEVDALRETIQALLARIGETVRHAERFAADAAHELRTPLTSIRGELELLMEDPSLRRDAQRDLTRATAKVIELQTLLERLLVLALPDQSQWSATEVVSLQDLTEDSVARLPDADRQRVRLHAPRGNVVVRGDEALLGMLFSNALSNALKFGRQVEVAAFEAEEDVVLQVDDDGPGVSPDQRTRVFEPFVRAPIAVERQIVGHGLGLALIAHVARRHGGSARFVDGDPGAHLEIRLPRR